MIKDVKSYCKNCLFPVLLLSAMVISASDLTYKFLELRILELFPLTFLALGPF